MKGGAAQLRKPSTRCILSSATDLPTGLFGGILVRVRLHKKSALLRHGVNWMRRLGFGFLKFGGLSWVFRLEHYEESA